MSHWNHLGHMKVFLLGFSLVVVLFCFYINWRLLLLLFLFLTNCIVISRVDALHKAKKLFERYSSLKVMSLNMLHTNVIFYAILYHLYNLENKNTYGGVLIIVKLQVEACNLLKVTFLEGCFVLLPGFVLIFACPFINHMAVK